MQKNPLIKEYLDIIFRRKYWIIVPALVGVLFAVALYFKFPKKYRAETRAQIRPQTISRALLNPIVDISSAELVTSINAEITSEKYVQELDRRLKLVGTPGGPRDIQELAKELDRSITLEVNARNRYFDLKVIWGDPRIAASMANELADIYIKSTEDTRRDLGRTTLDKLRKAREEAEQKLGEIRAQIEKYQSEHKFEIDNFRDTNVQRLATNRAEIDRHETDIRNFEDRIRQIDIDLQAPAAVTATREVNPRLALLERLRQELTDLLAQGKADKHPAVITHREQIAALEKELGLQTTGDGSGGATPLDLPRARLEQEKRRLEREIEVRQQKIKDLAGDSSVVTARLERTPDRQIELTNMLRTEDRLRQVYIEAMNKEQDAKEGTMLEDFDQGERFEILNRARAPKEPFYPDLRLFLFMGVAVGAGLGIGMVLLLEVFDQSFKSEEQLAAAIDLPILAVIPDLSRVVDSRKRKSRTSTKAAV